MALYIHSTSGSPPNVVPEITRKSVSYHPSIWGNKFLAYSNASVVKEDEHLQVLKQEVKKMLIAGDRTQQELISLIDDIQRLGLSYQFEAEVDTLLQHIKDSLHEYYGSTTDKDLHDIALSFRLLRQQGHNVSSVVSIELKDVKGMLSLFEAAHLRVHGENVLDDALEFTTSHLNQYVNSNVSRLVARHHISIYHNFDRHNLVLLDLAKSDYNLVQKLRQLELGHITRWWRDLDFAHKLPFGDRVVECYFWITRVYFEPHYAPARSFLTKVISLASVVDDIYDVHI